MKVPVFLLRRLYVSGSLRNTDDGWEFTLHNSIASGDATELAPLLLDGGPVPSERCFFQIDEVPVSFTAVGDASPFGLESGKDVTITVRGGSLTPGRHTVAMGFRVPVFGLLEFDFTDLVA